MVGRTDNGDENLNVGYGNLQTAVLRAGPDFRTIYCRSLASEYDLFYFRAGSGRGIYLEAYIQALPASHLGLGYA